MCFFLTAAPAAGAFAAGNVGSIGASAAFGASAASASAASAFSLSSIATYASLGLGALGTLTQIGSLRYQQQVAENNKKIAEWQAQDALERGRIEEIEHRRQVGGLIGTQRAALAGAGVEVDTGTAAELTADTAQVGELEAQNIRANAEREAYGYRIQAYNYQTEADLSYTEQLSTALSGATKVASRFAVAKTNRII